MEASAVIKASCISENFPERFEVKIQDQPLLTFIVDRLRQSNFLQNIVLATSDDPIDDFLVQAAYKLDIEVYRSTYYDSLGRLYGAANLCKSDVVVKVLGNYPFVDPWEIDKLVKQFIESKSSYSINEHYEGIILGLGVEVVKFEVLERVHKEVKKPFLLHLWSGALALLGFIFAAVGTTGEKFGLASPFFFLLVVAVVAAFFLNRTIWGRYLLALGNNEEGARYSGIQTDRLKITAYVICSFLAGLSGLLFAYELDSVQPAQTGEFYELYAIAAAVLGGCSLRGGQGAILGVIIAAAVIRLLRNSINLVGVSTHLEFAIIGLVILGGVTADEIIKRIVAKRRTAQVKAAKG